MILQRKIVDFLELSQKSKSKYAKKKSPFSSDFSLNLCSVAMALETESFLRPNLGKSADVPDVPPRTSAPLEGGGGGRAQWGPSGPLTSFQQRTPNPLQPIA